MRIDGDGPVGMLTAEANRVGEVRGYSSEKSVYRVRTIKESGYYNLRRFGEQGANSYQNLTMKRVRTKLIA
ncbi:Hsp33 family molecular chaperone HslO [Rhodohalobacter sp.]|uniref:Hsp33 family molecular chaperone HslO n=1 Tax=Rhodohalobacter sp. TaxID=1974210 RepID=UPI003A0FB94F